jgi:NAD(P)-dependent dehydrogenase (short-subunit alcohol dehydrogenase family)
MRKAVASRDKVAFITGANKGIGLETARGLGELGIAVVIGSRDDAKGRAACKLRAGGIAQVEHVRFHVTRPEDHLAIARHLEGRYGKLDILVNNAVAMEDSDFGAPGGFITMSSVNLLPVRPLYRRLNTTRPATFRPSIASWASATLFSGNRASISKSGYPPARVSFNATAAAVFAPAGKSSLPRKNRRTFLNTSGQKGIAGVGSPVA